MLLGALYITQSVQYSSLADSELCGEVDLVHLKTYIYAIFRFNY